MYLKLYTYSHNHISKICFLLSKRNFNFKGLKEGNDLFNTWTQPFWKERNGLFKALNTFYLQLFGIALMEKDHSDCERKPAAPSWMTLIMNEGYI